jgi:hypothetical protein
MGYIVDANGHLQYTHRKIVQIDCPLTADAVTVGTGAIGTTELAAGAATLPKVDFTGLKVIVAIGADADPTPADITVSGPVAGDRLVAVFGTLTAGGPLVTYTPGTDFEAEIAVTGKINQLQGDLDAYTFVFILVPAAA